MKIIRTIAEMNQLSKQENASLGLVPTMGYLHEGHLSLVKEARGANTAVVVSIFVNPTQFGPDEDFDAYPRDLNRDLKILAKEKTDIVFVPSAEEMFPGEHACWIEASFPVNRLEEAFRPGHFRGVTTVVAKLFNIIRPARAYFGQKDIQQASIIKKMVADLNMNIEITIVPTVREDDGLAMSSRNSYLSPAERRAATVLFRALTLARKMNLEGERDANNLRQQMSSLIQKEPLAHIDYVSVADADTLEELSLLDKNALAMLAVRIGKTRLIDNILLE